MDKPRDRFALGWEFDERNLKHLARRDIDQRIVLEVASNQPILIENTHGRAATHKMIGPDNDGQLWTFAVLEVEPEIWRVVTGWKATRNKEIRTWLSEAES
ncbi:MAG: hypothetical protein GEU28_09905 [Dehalococcoidia bacterium]|nr:hypothetical protein [Dehalococcoidia bacterium]